MRARVDDVPDAQGKATENLAAWTEMAGRTDIPSKYAGPPFKTHLLSYPNIQPLTRAALAAAKPDQQKRLIGQRLYPLVEPWADGA